MLFIFVVFAAASLADCFDGGCIGDECSAKDDSVLVQKRRAPETVTTPEKGLALEGGGFLAHAAHTGVLTALLSLTKLDSDDAPLHHWYLAKTPGLAQEAAASNKSHGYNSRLAALMSSVKTISTSSGGSWWMSQLAFSENFLGLIDAIAKKPETAGALYKERWMDPFLQALVIAPLVPTPGGEQVDIKKVLQSQTPLPESPSSLLDERDEVHHASNDSVVSENILGNPFIQVVLEVIVMSVASKGKSWTELVKLLLQSTSGDMTGDETLGSKVNEWAKGKSWLIGTAISSPGGSGPATCKPWKEEVCLAKYPGHELTPDKSIIYESSAGGNAWMYSLPQPVGSTSDAALWTPARFSSVLGAGGKAPMEFCVQDCQDRMFEYTANNESSLSQERNGASFATSDTSLFSAVSASSAAMGFAVTLSNLKMLAIGGAVNTGIMNSVKKVKSIIDRVPGLSWLIEHGIANILSAQYKLAVWSETAADGVKAFQEAAATVKAITDEHGNPPLLSAQSLADKELIAQVDGGLADNTGIGHALAAGRSEIICFVPLIDFFWLLFDRTADYMNFMHEAWPLPDFVENHFNQCPLCYASFKLFQETEQQVKETWEQTSTKLVLPPGVRYVNSIRVGTLQLTTLKNDYFGIEAGRRVTLHVVNINSPVGIGGVNYYDYPAVVQDVVDVLLNPSSTATGEIMSWFL